MNIYLMLLASLFFSGFFSEPNTSNRQIILLAENTMNPDLIKQQEILKADAGGLAERNIAVDVVTPLSDKNRYDKLMKNRKRFLFILIGKDGGEKLVSETPVSLEQLFGLIDSMPLRKYEKKNNSPH